VRRKRIDETYAMNLDALQTIFSVILVLSPLSLMALAWMRRLAIKPGAHGVPSMRRTFLTFGFVCGTLLTVAFYGWLLLERDLNWSGSSFWYWTHRALLHAGIILAPVTLALAITGQGRGRGFLALNAFGLSAWYSFYWFCLKDFRYP
jgi:hypothetical protein